MATLAEALANHVCAEGVKLILGCVVNRVSTGDADAVMVEGAEVSVPYRYHAVLVSLSQLRACFASAGVKFSRCCYVRVSRVHRKATMVNIALPLPSR